MTRLAACVVLALVLLPSAVAQAHSSGAVTVQAKIVRPKIVEVPGKIVLTPNHVKAGSLVTFVVTNTDPGNDHVFEINGRLTKFIPAGGHATLRNVRFAKPGTYVASCPDDDRGIGGNFIVTR
jgi:hypothetical protein